MIKLASDFAGNGQSLSLMISRHSFRIISTNTRATRCEQKYSEHRFRVLPVKYWILGVHVQLIERFNCLTALMNIISKIILLETCLTLLISVPMRAYDRRWFFGDNFGGRSFEKHFQTRLSCEYNGYTKANFDTTGYFHSGFLADNPSLVG